MIAPVAPSSSGRPSSPTSVPSPTTRELNGRASPVPPNEAAQTATAVPDSSSRPEPRTPPAAQPTSAFGSSALCTPSSIGSGESRWLPLANTSARSAESPSSVDPASRAASTPARSGSSSSDSPAPAINPPARSPQPSLHDTPADATRGGDRNVRPHRGGEDRRRD